jgi:hypothetical protein
MWRSVLLGVVLVGVLAGCSVGGGSRAGSGGFNAERSTPTAVGLSLVAQESPAQGAKRRWTTTRRVSLTCSTRPSATSSGSQSGRRLCDALAYYSHHVPTQPCIVRGVIVKYRRVEIRGSLYGHPVHLAMGLVCNPAPRLSRAVQTIYLAAFPTSELVVSVRRFVNGVPDTTRYTLSCFPASGTHPDPAAACRAVAAITQLGSHARLGGCVGVYTGPRVTVTGTYAGRSIRLYYGWLCDISPKSLIPELRTLGTYRASE